MMEIAQMSAKKQQELRQEYTEKIRRLLGERYLQQPYAHVHSYGCQQNVADGEKLMGMLAQMGYGFTSSPEEADLILYNTCAVRENAEDRVFGNVGALKHLKEKRPGLTIILCGCMVQQEHIAQKIRKSYPYVDIVFGTHMLAQFPMILHEYLVSQKRIFDISLTDSEVPEDRPAYREDKVKAWLPIMHGCNNFCSFCIVPYVRGRERSRRPEKILEEARALVAAGYKEIMLLGQNVNSYGKGLEEPINFAGLLRLINGIEGDFRIRFMTSHPRDCTHELIDTIAECGKVCKCIHLPVQSGCDRVLKEMNRHYDRASYLELIDYARKKIPDVAFTSDIIVGFPGETYEEFLETLDLVRQVRYNQLYTFIYSKRKGTRAAEMEDTIPYEERSKWFRQLLAAQQEISSQIHHSLIGSTVRVLAEGEGKSGAGYLTGRTDSNLIAEFPGPKELVGTFVNIAVTEAHNWAVKGVLVNGGK